MFRLTAILAIVMIFATPSLADEINTGRLDSIAIQGYDTMAYWTKGQSVEGEDTYEVEWKDATWRFASKEEAEAFARDPKRYAPLYGGHCANAMSLNKKVRADAEIWRIYGDYLALFAAERGRTRWDENDWEALKATADANWQELKDE